MKKNSLKWEIDLAFLAVVIVILIMVFSTYNRAQLVHENNEIVKHTSNINEILDKILVSTVDIETSARGYIITGDTDYLTVYNKADGELKTWIDSIGKLYKQNPAQFQKLTDLKRLISDKTLISSKMVEERRQNGMLAAAQFVKTGRGKELMNSIRKSISENQKEALQNLDINIQVIDTHVKARNTNFFLFVIVILLLLAVAYYQIRKNAKRLLADKIIQENLIDELTVQNRQLNEFASITSHNLRSPAANITALVGAVDDDSSIDDYKSLFQMLKKVGQNLNDSLNQLMEVQHINRNKLIEKEVIAFQQVFTKTIESLQGEILKSNALIESDFTAAPSLLYSPIYLESIFHNLISNALKYRNNAKTPQISVRSEIKGSTLLLHFADNGIGIDLARHGSKIFGMNQRFTNHPDSKGIGLFMTKTQIESMDGKITVASTLNMGSTFTIAFSV